MTAADVSVQRPSSAATLSPRIYWLATGLFCFMFIVSVLLTIFDLPGTIRQMLDLGFPVYLIWPQTVAKVLGVVAILSRRSRTLTNLAFAGFLYDLILALFAHIAERETYGLVAAFGLVLWGFAFWADRRRFPPRAGY